MARINLLPWREELRKQQKRDFLGVIGGSVMLTALVMVGIHMKVGSDIAYQNTRNQFLRDTISSLNIKIKKIDSLEEQKQRLLSKMGVIQQLQVSRPEIVHLFDELAITIPDGVYLESLEQKNRKVTLRGVAQSNARISTYMRNIENSRWVSKPVLNIIESKAEKKDKENRFVMLLEQVSQVASNEGDID